jgi:uncharacterized protein (TIGR02246 family)
MSSAFKTSTVARIVAVSLALASLEACADETPPPQPPPQPPPVAIAPPPPPPVDTTPPPQPPKPSLAELELAALKRWNAALNAHDPQAYSALFTPDAVRKVPGGPDVSGHEAIAKAVGDLFAREPDCKFAASRVFQKGNVVVVTWVRTATDSGTGGADGKPSGRPIGIDGAVVFWFTDDGLIKEQHIYSDGATVRAQVDPKAKAGTFRPPTALPSSTEVIASGSSDEDKLLAFGKAYYATLDSHKVSEIMAPVTDDSVMVDLTMPDEIKGTKAFKAMVGTFLKALPDFHQPLTGQWAIGDTLITEGTTEGTLKGALGPIRPTGKPVSVHFLDIVQFKEGKFVRGVTYSNGIELLTQVGMIKPAKK